MTTVSATEALSHFNSNAYLSASVITTGLFVLLYNVYFITCFEKEKKTLTEHNVGCVTLFIASFTRDLLQV